MNRLKTLTAVTAILAAGISIVIIFRAQIAIAAFAAANNITISYNNIKPKGPADFTITGLNVIEKEKGVGFSSADSQVRLAFNGASPGKPVLAFILRDVHFLNRKEMKAPSYSSIDALIALPFNGTWNYRTISGKISPASNGIYIRDFKAEADEIKFSLKGLLTRHGTVDAEIGLYFQDKLTDKIPPELTNVVLRDSGGGWKGLEVKIVGDLVKPSILVTGRLFRLNIGVKADNPS
ncbi:MAG: hypothetical protein JXB40_02325 [Candidatus Omnitrophica bacterium]|nr:hypothetical protein [Candidatus Omnitrophota bacterium]